MPPDQPDGFDEKPFHDPALESDTAAAPAEADFPGRSMERYSRRIYGFVWNGPTGPLIVTVTDFADYFGTRHWIEIGIPPDTLFPLDDFSFPVGASELARAGGAVALVHRLIAIAERTDYWKDAAAAPSPCAPPSCAEAGTVNALRDAIAGLISCKTYELSWNGPFGAVMLSVTDTETFFNRHHVIDIGVPPCMPFPLETLSYIATAMEIERAGGAKAFVESLIAAAESTAAWREYAARAPGDSPARPGRQPPPRPKPGRRRLKFDTPKR
jgi:hypothetical protein